MINNLVVEFKIRFSPYVMKFVCKAVNADPSALGCRRVFSPGKSLIYTALLKFIEGRVAIVEPQEKYIGRVFEIALNHEITVYGVLYVA